MNTLIKLFNKTLCALFGHQPPVYAAKGWWSPGESYARISNICEDGIKRRHATIKSECPRCGEKFTLCYVHLPSEKSNDSKPHSSKSDTADGKTSTD